MLIYYRDETHLPKALQEFIIYNRFLLGKYWIMYTKSFYTSCENDNEGNYYARLKHFYVTMYTNDKVHGT